MQGWCTVKVNLVENSEEIIHELALVVAPLSG